MELYLEIFHYPGAFDMPDGLSWLSATEVDDIDIDNDTPTYCVRDNGDLMATDINVLHANYVQQLDVSSILGNAHHFSDVPYFSNA